MAQNQICERMEICWDSDNVKPSSHHWNIDFCDRLLIDQMDHFLDQNAERWSFRGKSVVLCLSETALVRWLDNKVVVIHDSKPRKSRRGVCQIFTPARLLFFLKFTREKSVNRGSFGNKLKVNFCVNSWKFYPNQLIFWYIRDKFHVWENHLNSCNLW